MPIGLKKGVVKLERHDKNWAKLFEEEKKILLERFPNIILEVSHGGSTAIPNIVAKPIIDMFVAVPSLDDAERLRTELEQLGYIYRGKEDVLERILYLRASRDLTTHYLHFVEKNNDEWNSHLLIKEYYLEHPEAVKEYELLKKKLAEQYPNDRKSYTNGKDEFIKSIIQKAKEKKLKNK